MSRNIGKIKRVKRPRSRVKNVEELEKLIKVVFKDNLRSFVKVKNPEERIFEEEAAYFQTTTSEYTYSLTLDLKAYYSSEKKEEWCRHGSRQIQEKIRSYKGPY